MRKSVSKKAGPDEVIEAPSIVADLVRRFHEHVDAYHNGRYNETQIRREFIDPLFTALGWDVDNTNGYAEAYKDVIHEDAIKVGGATKAPDYCFRIGGTRKFFVEAKKPSVDIKTDAGPAFQLRRYAWSAKLPLSILTDFEEIAVYDCRVKPVRSDKAGTARVIYMRYDELEDRWGEIASIFSRESILHGSFDKYAESTKRKRGTAEVDDAFLAEIEQWRDLLARNIALRNTGLSQRDLNFAVQRTIDRIVFLRICEDRGIEQYGTLQSLVNGPRIYERLFERFRRADERYNSGLFHFAREKGRPDDPDDLTPALSVDDKPLKEILTRLYYPESPYEFSVLPADILGQVYEQFLGKVIRLTRGHRAIVEEKPEVRKAGGVYYTPTYIVDYIVRHTVGKLVEGKTPQQVGALTDKFQPSRSREARPLTVLDPACGSGSFLLGAYQFLLDWYRDRYLEDGPGKHATGKNPRLFQHRSGEWRLTIAERKRILLSHIHGVDIDSQAVETTKLSLLLKVLEGETAEHLDAGLKLFHERALPDLAGNIKCGNSLIAPDFYEQQQLSMFDEEERLRINVFDWNAEFKDVMQTGGFDAVIGNPPYIRIQTMRDAAPDTIDYYKEYYRAAIKGNYDIYVLFVERGLYLVNEDGKVGFILPHKFFNAKYGEALRKMCADGRHLEHIVHFTDEQVFAGAATYTCLLFMTKHHNDMVDYVKVEDLDAWRLSGGSLCDRLDGKLFDSDVWNINIGKCGSLLDRLAQEPLKLGDIASRMAQGIRTSANEIYVLDLLNTDGSIVTAYSKQLKKEVVLEQGAVSLFLQGREIKPYRVVPTGKIVIIPYESIDGEIGIISENEYRARYPATMKYLCDNREVLEGREKGRMKGNKWYGYVYPKNIEVMHSKKILVPDIADCSSFAYDIDGSYAYTSGYGIVLNNDVNESYEYILGLLNSKVLDFYLKSISTVLRGGFFRYFTQYIAQLPIHRIDVSNPQSMCLHDRMVSLVQLMMDLHKRLAEVHAGHERTALQRQVEATDRQIDQLVYELYGLSEEEIRLVEEATQR